MYNEGFSWSFLWQCSQWRQGAVCCSACCAGRHRAEVEREIAEFYGWTLPLHDPANPPEAEDPERAGLRRRLFASGIGGRQAEDVLDEFPAERIRRQLDWLPYRKARDRPRLLLAAIKEDYEEPRGQHSHSVG